MFLTFFPDIQNNYYSDQKICEKFQNFISAISDTLSLFYYLKCSLKKIFVLNESSHP